MKKKALNPMVKLYSAVVLVVISVSLMVSVTFAWFTLSTAPEVSSIAVSIGGDNTIMVAPNINTIYTDNGVDYVVSYPGEFSKNLDFSEYSSYNKALSSLLMPVSTTDGLNWFVPRQDENGNQVVVKSIDDYILDSSSDYANKQSGGYVFLDYWLLSPLENIIVRVSAGELNREVGIITDNGSYAVQLPKAVKDSTSKNGYALDDSYQSLAASIRVGFMVDDSDSTENEPMKAYMESKNYWEGVSKLRGSLQQDKVNFLVYEPNGLLHPNEGSSVILTGKGLETVSCVDGEYWITRHIGVDENGNASVVNVASNLVVQKGSTWTRLDDNALMLDDLFQAYLGSSKDGLSLHEHEKKFYDTKFPNGYMQYVKGSTMFEDTWYLHLSSADTRYVAKDVVDTMPESNVVVGSQIVRLKKNVPQRIRMFVWIEGQDVDCGSGVADQQIAIRLELAGSSGV